MTAATLQFSDDVVTALLRSRMLVQANSGGGKSHLLRTLLEQTHGHVQHLVLDPEGEFSTLRSAFPYVLAGKDGDVPAHPKVARVLCRRLVELGASAIVDLYDLSITERREFVKLFLLELMALPRALWKPVLVVLDEAHVFCPERGSGEAQSTEAVVALCTQGRKRGFAAVLATQRISKLHKDAAAELLNKAVGRTGLDVDMRRAGDELGFDKEQRSHLRELAPGEFFVYGPALGAAVRKVRTAAVRTVHPDAGGASVRTLYPAQANVQAMITQLGDLPSEAAREAETVAELQRTVAGLRTELRRAQQGKPAMRVDVDATKTVESLERLRRDITHVGEVNQRLQAGMASFTERVRTVAAQLRSAVSSLDAVEMEAQRAAEATAVPPATPDVVRTRTSITPSTSRRVTVDGPSLPSADALGRPISGPQQRMLNALREFEVLGLQAPAYSHVAIWSGQSPKSSGFDKNLSTLSALGLVARQSGKRLSLTADGRASAATVTKLRTLTDLHDAWIGYVSGPQQRMLRALIDCYPDSLSREQLASASDQSVTSSGFDKNCSTLSGLGLLARRAGKQLAAGDLLFPEGMIRE